MKTTPLLDYLFVFGVFTLNLDDFDIPNMELINLNKSTSIFKSQYILKHNGIEICTIVAYPHSSILPPDSGMIKISNWVLYSPYAESIVHDAFTCLSFQFKRVTRADICFDFTTFENGLDPHTFIQWFFSNLIYKRDKSKFKSIGSSDNGLIFDYLKFGSNYSQICSYIYNKSKELNEVKAKQWIYDLWNRCGWDGVTPVWRLEFSLKFQSKRVVSTDSGELSQFSLSELFAPSFRFNLFASLIESHFSFYTINQRDRGSQVITDKVDYPLFDFGDFENIPLVNMPVEAGSKKNKLLVKRLYDLHQEMKQNCTIQEVINTSNYTSLISVLGLDDWAKIKGISKLTDREI
jgi:hypothetical protein